VIWGSVPQQNKNFTGRLDVLEALRENTSRRVAVVSPLRPDGAETPLEISGEITDESPADSDEAMPRALHGLGGVGKTAIAIEYAHRYRTNYDVVWWIPADEVALVRSSLALLAERMNLRPSASGGIEGAAMTVLDALRRGDPYSRWLLVYDNADQPELISRLIPGGQGDVIITSRNNRWSAVVNTVEVDVFSRTESTEFLTQRVSDSISQPDAERLAEELGDLPLALEQAGALQAETGMSTDEYLRLLAEQPTEIMAEGKSADYPRSMTAAWMLSVSQLEDQFPQALDLLRCCAFFGPDPIPRDVFRRGSQAVSEQLRELIANPILLSRAIRELARFALVKIDGRSIEVHRLVQTLLRDALSPEAQAEYRHEVHVILAASAPDDPDDVTTWPTFAELVAHAVGEAANLASCESRTVRTFALKIVRYLYRSGDQRAARAFSERFVKRWTSISGPDDENVLDAQRHLGNALRELGSYAEAYEIIQETFERATRVLGEESRLTLALRNSLGADLRGRGDFAKARALDEESVRLHQRVFGEDDPQTLRAMGNFALDLGLNSEHQAARDLHQRTFILRSDDMSGAVSSFEVLDSYNCLARAVRLCGDLRGARDLGEEALDYGRANVGPDHFLTLRSAIDLAIVMRRMGTADEQALELATETYENCCRLLGPGSPDTMAAAVSLVNIQRRTGRLDEAESLAKEYVAPYEELFGPEHPYYFGLLSDLALLRRAAGDPARARELNETARAGLDKTVSRDHMYSLSVAIHLESDLAALGELAEARVLGEQTLQLCREKLGDDDLVTLGCAANLSLDLRALGKDAEAERLLADTVERYKRAGSAAYAEARAAEARERVEFDFDPPGV
jgi:tetratricopeptide (TPR) repeat protein